MAERLQEARGTFRVTFKDPSAGDVKEFSLTFGSSRVSPLLVEWRQDAPVALDDPGGRLSVETLFPVGVKRTIVTPLPNHVEDVIDQWLHLKRRELRKQASARIADGAEAVTISYSGDVRRI